MSEFELGQLKGTVEALQRRLDAQDIMIKEHFTEVNLKLTHLMNKFAQANGGWKAITVLTSTAVALGVFLSKFISIKWGA